MTGFEYIDTVQELINYADIAVSIKVFPYVAANPDGSPCKGVPFTITKEQLAYAFRRKKLTDTVTNCIYSKVTKNIIIG